VPVWRAREMYPAGVARRDDGQSCPSGAMTMETCGRHPPALRGAARRTTSGRHAVTRASHGVPACRCPAGVGGYVCRGFLSLLQEVRAPYNPRNPFSVGRKNPTFAQEKYVGTERFQPTSDEGIPGKPREAGGQLANMPLLLLTTTGAKVVGQSQAAGVHERWRSHRHRRVFRGRPKIRLVSQLSRQP